MLPILLIQSPNKFYSTYGFKKLFLKIKTNSIMKKYHLFICKMNVFWKKFVKIIVFDWFVSGFSCKINSQISCQFMNPNFN
jgi:hypothetical protein